MSESLFCREQVEQALFRRRFTYEEERGRWIRYPNAGHGKAVVVAQAAVDEMQSEDWQALLEEVDRRVAESEEPEERL